MAHARFLVAVLVLLCGAAALAQEETDTAQEANGITQEANGTIQVSTLLEIQTIVSNMSSQDSVAFELAPVGGAPGADVAAYALVPLQVSRGQVAIRAAAGDQVEIQCWKNQPAIVVKGTGNCALTLDNIRFQGCTPSTSVLVVSSCSLTLNNVSFSKNAVSGNLIQLSASAAQQTILNNVSFVSNQAWSMIAVNPRLNYVITQAMLTAAVQYSDQSPNNQFSKGADSPFSCCLHPIQLNSVKFFNNMLVSARWPGAALVGVGISMTVMDLTILNTQGETGASLVWLRFSQATLNNTLISDNQNCSVLTVSDALDVTWLHNSIITDNRVDNAALINFKSRGLIANVSAYRATQAAYAMAVEMQSTGCAIKKGDVMNKAEDVHQPEMYRMLAKEDHLSSASAAMGLNESFTWEDYYTTKFANALKLTALYAMLQLRRSSPLRLTATTISKTQLHNASLIHIEPRRKPSTPAAAYGIPDDSTLLDMDGVSLEWNIVMDSNSANEQQPANTNDDSDTSGRDAGDNNNGIRPLVVLNGVVGSLQNVTLVGNMGPTLIRSQNSFLSLQDVTVKDNVLSMEGIVIADGVSVNATRLWMNGNAVTGKLLYVKNTALQLLNSTVSNNRVAADWLVLLCDSHVQQLDELSLYENQAQAGVMKLTRTFGGLMSRVWCKKNAAACLVLDNPQVVDVNLNNDCSDEWQEVADSIFEANTADAVDSAALMVRSDDAWIKVRRTTFDSNKVLPIRTSSSGAAIGLAPFHTNSPAGRLEVEDCLFLNNTAISGGAVSTVSSSLAVDNSIFVGNQASMGGAVLCMQCQLDHIRGSSFANNTAPQGGAVTLQMLRSSSTDATPPSIELCDFENNTAPVERELPYNSTWENCPVGGGGAICLKAVASGLQIANCSFQNNTARWGGAILLNNDIPSWQVTDAAPCRLVMSQLTMQGNRAINGAGSTVFYNNIVGLCLKCPTSPLHILNTSSPTYALSPTRPERPLQGRPYSPNDTGGEVLTLGLTGCADWADSNPLVGQSVGTQHGLATYPASLQVEWVGENDVNGTLKSGGAMNISVAALDLYQHTLARPPNNITVTLAAEQGLLVYNFFPVMMSSVPTVFQNVRVQPYYTPNNTQYNLSVVAMSQQRLSSSAILVRVRNCFMGESISDTYSCVQCANGSFSHDPKLPCERCHRDGDCSSHGVMVPLPNYWKSTPYSPAVYWCPLEKACYHPNRTAVLQDLLEDRSTPLSYDTLAAFMHSQCGTGYTGTLCGNCARGYGRIINRCLKCPKYKTVNSLMIAGVLVLLCGFLAALVGSHIKAVHNSFSKPMIIESMKGAPRSPRNHLEAIGGLMKILVSYVHVLSISRGVQLHWPPMLRSILTRMDFSSSPAWLSLDCSMSHDTSYQDRTIKRVWLTATLPGMLAIASAIFWCGRAFLHPGPRHTFQYYRIRIILTTIQICYLLYPITTSTLFSIFTCDVLDRPQDSQLTALYQTVNASYIREGRFWSQNYNHQCYTDSHLLLAFTLGVPGVLLFTLGFPLASYLLLRMNKRQLDTFDTQLQYGFLYEEYRPKYFAWESVIMLRKALLLAFTIFLQPYGGSVQLSTASVIMILSIALHELCQPFVDSRLNNMERLSLYTNSLTLTGLTFLVDFREESFSLTVAAVIGFANITVFLYFVYRLLMEARGWLLYNSGTIHRSISTMYSSIKLKWSWDPHGFTFTGGSASTIRPGGGPTDDGDAAMSGVVADRTASTRSGFSLGQSSRSSRRGRKRKSNRGNKGEERPTKHIPMLQAEVGVAQDTWDARPGANGASGSGTQPAGWGVHQESGARVVRHSNSVHCLDLSQVVGLEGESGAEPLNGHMQVQDESGPV